MTKGLLKKRIKKKAYASYVGDGTKEREVLTKIDLRDLFKIIGLARKEFPKVDRKLVKMAQETKDPTFEQMNKVIMHQIDLAWERWKWFVKFFGEEAKEQSK